MAKKAKAKKMNTKKLLALFEDADEDDILTAATELDLVGGEEEESDFSEGDKVTFEDDGEEYDGKLKSIDGDKVVVTVGKGKKAEDWELEVGDITAA